MKMFMLIYGRKLADLERLEFYPFHPYNGVVLDASPLAKDFDGHSIIAPKLRVVRVPLQLLPGLRPILSNITVLETSAVDHPEPLKTHIQVDALLKMLEPYSNTLMSLTITDTNVSSIRKRRSVNIVETPSPTPVPKPPISPICIPPTQATQAHILRRICCSGHGISHGFAFTLPLLLHRRLG